MENKMKAISMIFLVAASISIPLSSSATEYFYCGYSNLNGSGQDYAKWGKGTDFKYNDSKQRWEWVTEHTYRYIYTDGRYELRTRTPAFDNQVGKCNAEMEMIYKKKIDEITKKYR